MKRLLYSMAVALLLVSSAVIAKADTLIESWTYSVSGIFTEWSPTRGVYSDYPETLDGTSGYRKLSWGSTRYDQSSLTISDTVSGTVLTDGGAKETISVTHDNKSISLDSGSLTSGKMFLEVELTPDIAGVEPLIYTLEISFDFIETANTGYLDNDIFIITDIESSMEDDTFVYDGYEYTFSFFGTFWNLNEDYPAYVAEYLPAGSEYYGWVTKEGSVTTLATYLTVESDPVRPDPHTLTPEPGTVLLMGAGLAGLAFMARRRSRK